MISINQIEENDLYRSSDKTLNAADENIDMVFSWK